MQARTDQQTDREQYWTNRCQQTQGPQAHLGPRLRALGRRRQLSGCRPPAGPALPALVAHAVGQLHDRPAWQPTVDESQCWDTTQEFITSQVAETPTQLIAALIALVRTVPHARGNTCCCTAHSLTPPLRCRRRRRRPLLPLPPRLGPCSC